MAVNGTFKWIAAGLLTVVMTIGGVLGQDIRQEAKSSHRKADSAHRRVDSLVNVIHQHILEQKYDDKVKQLQLSEIAKAVGAKVVVDTVNAADTTRDST